MKCPICGSRIDENATYCIDCGSILDAAVPEDLSAYHASQGITGTHISLFSSLLALDSIGNKQLDGKTHLKIAQKPYYR